VINEALTARWEGRGRPTRAALGPAPRLDFAEPQNDVAVAPARSAQGGEPVDNPASKPDQALALGGHAQSSPGRAAECRRSSRKARSSSARAGLCPEKLGGAAPRTPSCLHGNQADDRFAQALAGLSQRLQLVEPDALDPDKIAVLSSPLRLVGC